MRCGVELATLRRGCDRLAGHLSTVRETRSPSPKTGWETGANNVEIIVVM
jgi:hypothetical protein